MSGIVTGPRERDRNFNRPGIGTTLFVAGQYDEATPSSTQRFARMVPGAEFQVIPNAAHATEHDNPDELLRVVRDFIRRVEASAH